MAIAFVMVAYGHAIGDAIRQAGERWAFQAIERVGGDAPLIKVGMAEIYGVIVGWVVGVVDYVSVVNAIAKLRDVRDIQRAAVIDDPIRLVCENIGMVIRIKLRVRQRDDCEVRTSAGGFELTIECNGQWLGARVRNLDIQARGSRDVHRPVCRRD